MEVLPPPEVSWDFFISYPSAAFERAGELQDWLTSTHRTFFDRVSLSAGSNWAVKIPKAQAESLVTVALISKDFHSAWYTLDEVAAGIAYERLWGQPRHQVVPIYLDGTLPSLEEIPYGLRCRKGIYVQKEGSLESAADELKLLLKSHSAGTVQADHPLLKYPRGPMVEAHHVSSNLIEDYARLIREQEARQVIADANAFRLEADQNASTIKDFQLPHPGTASSYTFWLEAFREARRHGPRMLAALLMVLPDDQFDLKSQENRYQLLNNILLGR